jgi:hypothetical protein
MRCSELPNAVTNLTPYHSNEINESNQDKEIINKQAYVIIHNLSLASQAGRMLVSPTKAS